MAQGDIGVLFNNLRGKAGSVVFARGKDGTVVRPRVTGRNPRTPAQVAVRANLAKAGIAYKNMTPAQLTAWRAYAESQTSHDPETGKTYAPSAISVFTGLASKFLQATPMGTIPMTPPTSSFGGDNITVTATGDPGVVTFQANTANAANVTTELLLQPLKSSARMPQPNGYRSKAFKAFAINQVDIEIEATPGFYVPAYRFVNTLTGQDTGLIVLPMVQVL